MAKINTKDFIEIEFTGKIKDEDFVFDTTDEKIAKDNNIFDKKHRYGAIKIMVGGSQVLPGLDRFMQGKEPGEYKVTIEPGEGYGKKNPKLLQLISRSNFTKHNINPVPSLPINIDGKNGIIKTVSGGRCMVDFNHPLSGKYLTYDLKINKIITDEKGKIESILELQLKPRDYKIEIEGEKAKITSYIGLKDPLKDLLVDMIKKFTKVKEVEIIMTKKSDKV